MNFQRRFLFLIVALASVAYGHFSFVIPQAGGKSAQLIISEDLHPDPAVDVSIAKGAQLTIRDESGAETPLTLVKGDKVFTIDLPGKGLRMIHGVIDLGISPAGRAPKPYLLVYYPKSIVGSAFAEKAKLGGTQPLELVPVGEAGKTSLLFLVHGKPQPDTEVTVIQPDGNQSKVKTDANGVTPPFTQTGRYGAWARSWEPGTGDRDGKAYEQVRNYATIVFDALAVSASLPSLPEATSSFGAVVDQGFLYVYGGHISPTHTYSTNSVSGQFNRMNLSSKKWEALPAGPALQGMNLAVYKDVVYRIGGMQPRNSPGTKQDIHSVVDAARYDPAVGKWTALPSLPEPRSSHDVVVIGGKLIVAGGWTLRGSQDTVWANTVATLDLSSPDAKWEVSPQPFERRALIAAVHKDRMYVMGGITRSGAVSSDVDVYDPKTNTWVKGPALPGPVNDSFAPAACDHEGTLWVSLADGGLYKLNDGADRWEAAAKGAPRLAHRMVSADKQVIVLGGAIKGNNLDLVEAFRL